VKSEVEKAMIITFEKLGILNHAKIELGDFTIICGRNNTGKTYATYAVYGFLRTWWRLNTSLIDREQFRTLLEQGSLEIDLQETVLTKWSTILSKLGSEYHKLLPAVLAADPDRFMDTRIHIDLPKPTDRLQAAFEKVIRINEKEPLLSISKAEGSLDLKLVMLLQKPARFSPVDIMEFVSPVIQDLLFGHALPHVFMASTERTGAAIFKNELNFSRTRLIEALATLEHSKKLTAQDILPALMPEFNPRYAFPVRDNVDFINQLDTLTGSISDIAKGCPELLDDFRSIIGGEYRVVRKEVYFVPEKASGIRLNLGESSSAVRSLLDIGFYLQFMARKGDLLMIDEPELNLHPENQRKVVRLLARIVNAGIRVFVTTHSDYIAKELNTLLLLGKSGGGLASKYNYHQSELLRPEQIRLYIAEETIAKKDAASRRSSRVNTLSRIDALSDGSFEFASFDDTIEEMNRIQRRIWDELANMEEN
jgi:hypothetical protein